jgi:O-antigen/teichoic acid export membrane protein
MDLRFSAMASNGSEAKMIVKRSLSKLLEAVRHPDGFLRPLLTLMSGTVIAHGITALSLIILARLYTPQDFGVFGLFTSVYYLFSVVVCLRFDIAIPLADSEVEAQSLLSLSILSSVGFATATLLALMIAPSSWIAALGLQKVEPFLLLMPIALLSIGVFIAFQSWAVRQKRFGDVAKAKIAQTAGASLTQLGFGLAFAHPLGLILGAVVNSLAGLPTIIRAFSGHISLKKTWPDRIELKKAYAKNRSYLRYSTWEALANTAAIQVPILMIGALSGEAELGHLLFAMSILQAPAALMSAASAQIFSSRAPAFAREGKLYPEMISITRHLLWAGAIPILAIGLASPFVFPLLFGETWARSGEIALWLTPWFVLQFLASPTSMVLHVVKRHKTSMMLQVGYFLVRVIAVWLTIKAAVPMPAEIFAVSGGLVYLAALIIGLVVAHEHDESFTKL